MSVNTNVVSLNAQRNTGATQSALAISMQRLSSGLRVNSAKDDAAGLAISERMNAQIKGLNVAARNANDGISLAQTAEGALGKVGDMLQRMRELAVQSANATNNQTDRDALQAEVAQLKEEIGRVATTTKFNGTTLLDGSFTAQSFQVGANSGETISLAAIADADLAALGTLQTSADSYDQTLGALTATDGALATSLDINGVSVAIAADVGRDAATALTELVAAFDAAKTANPTALAGVTMAADGAITSATTTDVPLVIANVTNLTGVSAGTTNGTLTEGASETGIANLTIASAEDAAFAMDAIDSALTAVNTARGTLGAVQSRFENAIANIQVTSENLAAARGRIVDADFAAETASLSRAQILQQAGTAMIAQANQLPQQVLSLLR
jgi:flagellin